METKEMNLYDTIMEHLNSVSTDIFSSDDARTWENNWFYMYITNQNDEDVRMCVVVALLVYEIQYNKLTANMLGELNYYYREAFVNKSLNDVFDESESKQKCFDALKWCYDKAKEKELL